VAKVLKLSDWSRAAKLLPRFVHFACSHLGFHDCDHITSGDKPFKPAVSTKTIFRVYFTTCNRLSHSNMEFYVTKLSAVRIF